MTSHQGRKVTLVMTIQVCLLFFIYLFLFLIDLECALNRSMRELLNDFGYSKSNLRTSGPLQPITTRLKTQSANHESEQSHNR